MGIEIERFFWSNAHTDKQAGVSSSEMTCPNPI